MSMDIVEAIEIMDQWTTVPGCSDQNLVDVVQPEVDQMIAGGSASKTLTIAGGTQRGVTLRPVDAMLRLSRATRPLVSDDVYDWYRHWSLLRYLGVFRLQPNGTLGLSPAGDAVHANQRRVMSEELGVAFGVIVAELWCRSLGASGPISIIDIDFALNEGQPWFQGYGASPTVGSRQPDYILSYHAAADPRRLTFKSLECKGTKSRPHAIAQLARAATQLQSLRLGGRTPQGIAVCTVSKSTGIEYLALDPEPEDDLDIVQISDADIGRARQQTQTRQRRVAPDDVPLGVLLATSLLADCGNLADYAGSYSAAAQFLPARALERRARMPQERRSVEFGGEVYRGIEYQLPTPQGRPLRIFMGVASPVDEALMTGDLDLVAAAQQVHSEQRESHLAPDRQGSTTAISDDGAVLSLQA